MKAAVFHKPGDIRYNTVEDPRIEQDTDVILKVTSTAICGSDLHIPDLPFWKAIEEKFEGKDIKIFSNGTRKRQTPETTPATRN